MTFTPVLSRAVIKALDALDRTTEARVRSRIKQIAVDPFDPRLTKPLTHPRGLRSSRIGGWRMLFTVDRDRGLVEILSVEPRGQAYREL